ncbi:MAG: RNA polymerase sigma factor [Bacteroidetes bacterium]|nr:RNA polymerase sigma factor [Bacteroidota bacterium]
MDQTILQAEQTPDTELIKRILAGEKRLFEQIIRRYNQRLFRIGMAVLNDDMEAEDAMQTAYINAYEHLKNFENRSSFETWLIRIMLNECLAQKRKKQRFGTEAEGAAENIKTMTSPDKILMNKELSGVLEQAIAQLPEKYRMVFVLREIEQMSVKATGEALSIEEPNVKVRLNRAKTMLRESLNGYIADNVYSFHLSRCDRIVANVFAHLQL